MFIPTRYPCSFVALPSAASGERESFAVAQKQPWQKESRDIAENNYKRGRLRGGQVRGGLARDAGEVADIPGRVIMVKKNRYNSDGL